MMYRGRCWVRSLFTAIPASAALVCIACTSEAPGDAPADAAVIDAAVEAPIADDGMDGPAACDPAGKPPDCGPCWPPGKNGCGGKQWRCRPDGVWDQLQCDPPPIDAAIPCSALDHPGSVGDASADGGSAQRLCEPDWTNHAACPSAEPAPGSVCDVASLECVYAIPGALAVNLSRCDDGQGFIWTSTAVPCGAVCSPPDDGGVIAVPGTCGSGPDVACGGVGTLEGDLNWMVREIAACCGGLDENQLNVQFEDGCATAFWVDRTPAPYGFEACFASLMAGRRFSCAATLTCAQAMWSTIV